MMRKIPISSRRSLILLAGLILGLSWLISSNWQVSSAQEIPTPALPPVLQQLVDANPPGERPTLYPVTLSGPAIDIAEDSVADGVYWIDSRGVSAFWGPTEQGYRPIFGLSGVRTLQGLSRGGNGFEFYGWDFNSTVWRREAPEFEWVEIGSLFEDIDSLVATSDGETLYAKAGETLWIWRENDREWLQSNLTPALDFWPEPVEFVVDSNGDVFTLGEYDVLDARGDFVGLAQELQVKDRVSSDWLPAGWNLPSISIDTLATTTDAKFIWLITSNGELWLDGVKWPASQVVNRGINALMKDPFRNEVIYAGTRDGLFVHINLDEGWLAAGGEGQGQAVNDIAFHQRWNVPLVATENGIFFLIFPGEQKPASTVQVDASPTASAPTRTVSPTPAPTATPHPLILWVNDNKQKVWFWPLSVISGFLGTYVLGMAALIIWAWRGGTKIFGRLWLESLAAKPLTILPGLGRWALFLGYRNRLRELLDNRPEFEKAVNNGYFGLPARSPTGEDILPHPDGNTLHERIVEEIERRPVVVIGKGGSGKTTLAGRLVSLTLAKQLHPSMQGFLPILVTPHYYKGNFVQAITAVLRERDEVAVTTRTTHDQLSSGKLFVLFDGVSEVEDDKAKALREILLTALNADYKNSRFLVTTRPLEKAHPQAAVFRLQPLKSDVIRGLLDRYGLNNEQQYNIKRQLDSFGDKSIEPLLFTMMIEQSQGAEISQNRAKLYESYFQIQLNVRSNQDAWRGWLYTLERLGQWFMLDTGQRGVGLSHIQLIDLINGKQKSGQTFMDLISETKSYHPLPVNNARELTQRLRNAGILHQGRRWRFAHDTFEEYFAASRIVSHFEEHGSWPDLSPWVKSSGQKLAFLGVIEFIHEIAGPSVWELMAQQNVPKVWKNEIQ